MTLVGIKMWVQHGHHVGWLMETPPGTGTARGAGCKAQYSFPQFLLGAPETLLEAIPYAVFLRSNVIFFFFYSFGVIFMLVVTAVRL